MQFEEDPRGARVLRVIQRMYRLEAVAKERKFDTAQWLEWRQRKTKPLLEAFFRWLETLMIPSTYDLHKALRYIMRRKDSLMLFLGNPGLAPDIPLPHELRTPSDDSARPRR